MSDFFEKSAPGAPYVSIDQVAFENVVKNLSHVPPQLSQPAGPNRGLLTLWNKLADLPSAMSIRHTKAPVQR